MTWREHIIKIVSFCLVVRLCVIVMNWDFHFVVKYNKIAKSRLCELVADARMSLSLPGMLFFEIASKLLYYARTLHLLDIVIYGSDLEDIFCLYFPIF